MIRVHLEARDRYLGLIVPGDSGVTWRQLTGPVDDLGPYAMLEGVYVPLDPDWKWPGTPDPLEDAFRRGLALSAHEHGDAFFLTAYPDLASRFRPPTPAELEGALAPEWRRLIVGWVPVVVKPFGEGKERFVHSMTIAEGLEGKVVVLVYNNGL